MIRATPKPETDSDLLREIIGLLKDLVKKPNLAPKFEPKIEPQIVVKPTPVNVQAPDVHVKVPEIKVPPMPPITVKPPEVKVTVPEHKVYRKWQFELKRDYNGYTKEIIATALE